MSPRSHEEKTLSTTFLYRGRIVKVRQDRVKTGAGRIAYREVVEHPGAVAVLALAAGDRVVMVRQFRQPARQILLEIPAGKLEPGEEPLACARRELLEETGLVAAYWKELCLYYPSPGFCDEVIHLFRADGLSPSPKTSVDPDEEITVETVELYEAWSMIEKGEIRDGKTILALQQVLLKGCRKKEGFSDSAGSPRSR